jgi:hypothetical protein
MIKEALEFLASQARLAADVNVLDNIKDPRAAHMSDSYGKPFTVAQPKPPRKHVIESLVDLIQLANRFAQNCEVVTWYNESCVTVVLDDDGHRIERATFTLNESELFQRVRELKKQRFDIKAFVRLLKVELVGTLDPHMLLNIVRSLKFENGIVVKAKLDRQSESMGREIVSAVSGDKDIPEFATLQLPVYRNLGERERFALICSVEVDPSEGRFALIPFPDEIERVQQMAVQSIHARLEGGLLDTAPCYYGSP